ncbi:prolyl-tRNA synthetase [Caminicella sporogenes DSM 14501]|uniref:Prolyl-tRNA synthetase n=1 Tax=Caminicella sporogenes DSM 14501 TaxID=1121266 RepID=A0A1M6SR75_9FIRM|nr:YbaK/EbsC family protein [Caminicella sporogenes]RKD26420.1 hypothetical protein BET04_10690 [Caminicella sporogenes]SHK47149.1 prolyl-tRNA synthetase [Caminicella sporogenes DSM 14501]
MYMSKLVGKTLKKIDDEFYLSSQELLIKSGMFRNIDSGIFTVLPLGVKVLDKLVDFLIKRIENLGFQRIYLSNDSEFVKNMSLSIRNEIKSYKELPVFLYDVQTLKRDKVRIKEGLFGAKEYKELRGCSFYKEDDDLSNKCSEIIENYKKMFKEIGLEMLSLSDYNPKNSGDISYSFVVKADWGDKVIYKCKDCDYTSLEEVASFNIDENASVQEAEIEEIYTPDIKTIKELENFLGIKKEDLAKTLLVKIEDEVVAVVLRGDRELNLYKLSKVLKVSVHDIKMAEDEDIKDLNTVTGFVGPVGLKGVKIIADREIYKGGLFIAGANKKDYHIKNVVAGRDFKADIVADVSYVKEEDRCPICGGSFVREYAVKIGGFYDLGKINEIKNFNYKDSSGKTREIVGIYHYIDIYKLLSVVIEKHHDEDGIIWPIKIAPYHIIVSILSIKDEEKVQLGEKIYEELKGANFDVILDDRNERAGVKFKDADLLGIPVRIVIGKKASEKIVEYKLRWESEKEELKVHEALGKTMKLLKREEII